MIATFDRWVMSPAPATRLAVLRILICGFVVVYLAVNVGEFDRLANRDPVEFEPVGVVGILDRPLDAWMIWIVLAVTGVSGIAALAGVRFRISGPAFAVATLFWASYHSSWGQMLHFEHLFTIHLLILALSPAAEAWSFDAQRTGSKPQRPSSRYGWPIRLMALATTSTYVIAGIAKLRLSGLSWIDGTTLQNHIAYSATRSSLLGGFEPPLASFVVNNAWMLGLMAVAAVLVELAAPVALFGRTWRGIWIVYVMAMHLGTALTMFVWFPYQGLGLAFLPLFHVEKAALLAERNTRGLRAKVRASRP